jgi:hypothetical protein
MLEGLTVKDVADGIADRIREETDSFQNRHSTQTELAAAAILHGCYRFGSSEAFAFIPKLPGVRNKQLGAPWTAGDLAFSENGSEFIYAYLPVRFVEKLLEKAQQAGFPSPISETLTASGTVYFLNNLRKVIDEALVGLAFEASMVVDVLGKAIKDKDNGLSQTRDSFAKIVDEIISEANTRRRDRIRGALWEIDPRLKLSNLTRYYLELYPSWKKAGRIYKRNRDLETWSKVIQDEIFHTHHVQLPDNLVSLLNNEAESPTAEGNIELTPSGLALEHAARTCGVEEFKYSTGYLRQIIGAQKKQTKKTRA